VDMMKAWEATKIHFNPVGKSALDGSATPVRIDMAAVIGSKVLGETSMRTCVERYNETKK
jgi:hypothetical protein